MIAGQLACPLRSSVLSNLIAFWLAVQSGVDGDGGLPLVVGDPGSYGEKEDGGGGIQTCYENKVGNILWH